MLLCINYEITARNLSLTMHLTHPSSHVLSIGIEPLCVKAFFPIPSIAFSYRKFHYVLIDAFFCGGLFYHYGDTGDECAIAAMSGIRR